MEQARENSKNAKENNTYGIYLESDKYTLFQGETYDGDEVIETITLPNFIHLEDIFLEEGETTIVFKKNTGETDQYGSFKLNNNDQEGFEFTVEKYGNINVEHYDN